jgi:tRNA(fMet)-specific endonuclease VapC
MQQLENLLRQIPVIDINGTDKNLVEAYAEIDAYSQGKLEGKSLGGSPHNMGKNDLWIAATAKVAGASLITTDDDFNHLNGVFIKVIKYSY